MANTYSQINLHVVFSVKSKFNKIPIKNREELEKYISGIIRNQKQKLLAIFCNPDHIHLFISVKPDIAISDLIRDIKRFSTLFINEKKWIGYKFNWQEGFGVFSYSNSQIPVVCNYIAKQEIHHKKKTFKDEYLKILHDFKIEYDKEYVFEWIE